MGGLKAFTESFDSFAILADEEFFKIPRDITAFDWFPNDEFWIAHHGLWVIGGRWQFGFQPSEYGMSTLSIG